MAANHPKASISSHRLFPAIVALWFATLFGLGFLVLPGHAFERIVQASGISAIIPAAGPPLGFTARLLVSVGAAIAGALAGYSAARAIAPRREQDEETRARRESRRERTEAQMQSLPEVTRRRPLSAMTDLGPPMDAPVSQEEAAAPLWAQEPEEDFAPEFVPELEIEPAIELDAIKIVAEELPQADVGLQVLPSPVAGVESPRRETRADELNLPSDPEADLSRMGVVQLAERLGIAMQRRAARPKSPPPAALAELATYLTGAKPAASPAQPTPSARQAPSAPQIPATQNVAPLPVAPPAPASRVEPLAAAERILGRASTASVPEPAPVPAPPPRMAQEIEAFDEEDYDDEDDIIASLSLPLAGLTPVTAPLVDEVEDEADGEDDSYSSLLTMRLPPRVAAPENGDMAEEAAAAPSLEAEKPAQTSEMPAPTGDVRPFSQPIMTPSGRPWADRAETERVLRNALAAIQRKTGAA